MILSINSGSTSLKYKLFTSSLEEVKGREFDDIIKLKKGYFEHIAEDVESVREGISNSPNLKVVHRVVHGGPKLRNPVLASRKVIKEIKKYSNLAPLHNPYNIRSIKLSKKIFKKARHWIVFDTGFYADLPDYVKKYPIPSKYKSFKNVERFGFHGISHNYALYIAKKELKKRSPNIISIHLGGGASITAIKSGKAIETSMGYTPMEGLMMWSRSGDIDPYITLMSKFKMKRILNFESGLKGVSGCSNYLELLDKYLKKDKSAVLAFNMFIYRIRKYIGSYFAVLEGKVDAIVFTGRIGAGNEITRNEILKKLLFLKRARKIIVDPNEEFMMAKIISNLK